MFLAATADTSSAAPVDRSDSPHARVTVLIHVPGDVGDGRLDLVQVLPPYTAGLGVECVMTTYDPTTVREDEIEANSRTAVQADGYAAVLWVVPHPLHTLVYTYDGESESLGVREVPSFVTAPELAMEQVTNIVVSTLSMLLESHPAPVPEIVEQPEPTPEPMVPKPLEPKPRDPDALEARLLLDLSYIGRTFAEALPWQHGVAVSIQLRPRPRVGVGLRIASILPARRTTDGVSLTFASIPIEVFGSYTFVLHPKVDFTAKIHAGVEPVRRSSEGDGTWIATEPSWRVFSYAGASMGVDVRPTRRMRMSVDVGAEALITRARYTAHGPDGPALRVAPHPIRAFIRVGFGLVAAFRDREPKPHRALSSRPAHPLSR